MGTHAQIDVFNKDQPNPYNMSVESHLVIYTTKALTKYQLQTLMTGIRTSLDAHEKTANTPPFASSVQILPVRDPSRQYVYIGINYGPLSYDILHEYVRRIRSVLLSPSSFNAIASETYNPNAVSQ